MSLLLITSLILVYIPIIETTTLAPNHVAINPKRKHIDADTSWLEPDKHNVQKVHSYFLFRKTLIMFISMFVYEFQPIN